MNCRRNAFLFLAVLGGTALPCVSSDGTAIGDLSTRDLNPVLGLVSGEDPDSVVDWK